MCTKLTSHLQTEYDIHKQVVIGFCGFTENDMTMSEHRHIAEFCDQNRYSYIV
jgi:hypothetical protein